MNHILFHLSPYSILLFSFSSSSSSNFTCKHTSHDDASVSLVHNESNKYIFLPYTFWLFSVARHNIKILLRTRGKEKKKSTGFSDFQRDHCYHTSSFCYQQQQSHFHQREADRADPIFVPFTSQPIQLNTYFILVLLLFLEEKKQEKSPVSLYHSSHTTFHGLSRFTTTFPFGSPSFIFICILPLHIFTFAIQSESIHTHTLSFRLWFSFTDSIGNLKVLNCIIINCIK